MALEILRGPKTFSLILLDFSFLDQDAARVLTAVCLDGRRAATKILVTSGWDNLQRRVVALGADDYVQKPILMEELERRIERLLA